MHSENEHEETAERSFESRCTEAKQQINVLIVEDSCDDFDLMLSALRKRWPGACAKRCDTVESFTRALEQNDWDAVLADYQLPSFSGLQALRISQRHDPDLPFILISGTVSEETAVEAMRSGARDYVLKNNMTRLCPAVERELQEVEVRRARRAAERRLAFAQEFIARLLDYIPVPVDVAMLDGTVRTVNRAWESMTGSSRELAIGRKLGEVLPSPLAEKFGRLNEEVIRTGAMMVTEEVLPLAGKSRHHHIVRFPLLDHNGDIEAVGGLSIDITEKKQTESELQRSLKKLRALSAHLEFIREEERTRISREVHDELGQALTALKMDLAWLTKRLRRDVSAESLARIHEKTQEMHELINGTIQKVRQISSDLRPGVLDQLGLPAAIEWQVKDFQNRTGIGCSFSGTVRENELPPDRCTALFRILQESLTNVLRHAGASEVWVSLREDSGIVTLEVRDNGKGIEPEEITDSKSLGLIGMQERASMFGGTVTIEGWPSEGTLVQVRMKMNAEVLSEAANR